MAGGQLDLWGAGGAELRWVSVASPGALGRGPLETDLGALRSEHRVSVVVAVVDDPGDVVARAEDEGIDVRHLAPVPDGLPPAALGRHAAALATDARAGRRAVVLGDDARASVVLAAALVELGATVDEAMAEAGAPSDARKALTGS